MAESAESKPLADETAATTSSPLTEEEAKTLTELFKKMGARPKVEGTEGLVSWISSIVSPSVMPTIPVTSPLTTPSQQEAHSVDPTLQVNNTPPPPNVLVTSTRKPWLVKFTGEGQGYMLWRYQLVSLMKENHSTTDIFDAIRSSLQGKAGDDVARLGTDSSLDAIIRKMDSIYGDVGTESDLLASFYGARQMDTESISDWGRRLEALLDLAKQQGPLPRAPDIMLRTMMWTGLRQPLKEISGYKFDKIDNFNELRIALRRLEKEHHLEPSTDIHDKSNKKPAPVKVAQNSESSAIDELTTMVRKLSTEVANLKKDLSQNRPSERLCESPNTFGNDIAYGNRRKPNNTPSNDQQERLWHGRNDPPRYATHGQQRRQSQNPTGTPTCYKCGQEGHISIGCRVRTDHVRRPQDFRGRPI